MNEPRLEDIGDYNELKGEKKKVVWIVVLVGLVIGILYSVAYSTFDNDDTLEVKDSIKNMPVR